LSGAQKSKKHVRDALRSATPPNKKHAGKYVKVATATVPKAAKRSLLTSLSSQSQSQSSASHVTTATTSSSYPENWDWRDVDGVSYVTPVVSQGGCGSCYAVASAATYESRWRVASDNAVQPFFSAQETLSCSKTNQGCEGGFPYLIAKHGFEHGFVDLEAMSYSGSDDSCPEENLATATRYKLSDYGYVGGFYGNCSEEAMMKEIYENGPIVVAFECPSALFYYDGGIFDGECGVVSESEESDKVNIWEATNHAVIAVGWGLLETTGQKYWIIKNTWGAQWGEAGYFRIARGADECAVESMAVWGTPIIE